MNILDVLFLVLSLILLACLVFQIKSLVQFHRAGHDKHKTLVATKHLWYANFGLGAVALPLIFLYLVIVFMHLFRLFH